MKFTIVTPSYNKGRYLERTIESVLAQQTDGVNIQYIVRDNLSTDNTVEILKRYEVLKNLPIEIIRSPDRGQFDAINQGWLNATGDILGWLNADDVYFDNALFHVAQFFEANPTTMAIYGEALYIDAHDNTLKPVTNIRDYSQQLLQSHDFITQPATFIRKQVFTEVGLLSHRYRYVFDWEYWLRVSKLYDFVRIPEQLAGYRITGENLTTNGKMKRLQEMNNLVMKYGGLSNLLKFWARLTEKYLFHESEIPPI